MIPSTLVLFDVDATLLLTGGAGMRAMERAARELFGAAFVWDGIEPSGGLDPLLFAEAVARSRLELGPEAHALFQERYIDLLRAGLLEARAAIRVLPGIQQVLAELRAREDVGLGLLTGNYARGAALKLEAAGIDPGWFSIGAFGDEGSSRAALVSLALERFAASHGSPIHPSRAIVVGDTPRDVEAALANGCLVLGVATGKYGTRALLEAGASRVVEDLSDPSPLYELIDGKAPRVR